MEGFYKGSNSEAMMIRHKLLSGLNRLIDFLDNNNNTDFYSNGEESFMVAFSKIKAPIPNSKPIIFDVGANKGDWTDIAKSRIQNAELHLFEPSVVAYNVLMKRYSCDKHMGSFPLFISNVACSDKNETLPLYYDHPGSTLASLTKRDLSFYNINMGKSEEVKCIRLYDYIRGNNITHIDLLKIDVEGHELTVLKGLGDYFNTSFIDFVQFEYGGANIDTHTTLRDLFEIFNKSGFRVGKLFPRGIEFNNYVPRMENFQYSNWVAVSNKIDFK